MYMNGNTLFSFPQKLPKILLLLFVTSCVKLSLKTPCIFNLFLNTVFGWIRCSQMLTYSTRKYRTKWPTIKVQYYIACYNASLSGPISTTIRDQRHNSMEHMLLWFIHQYITAVMLYLVCVRPTMQQYPHHNTCSHSRVELHLPTLSRR